MSASHPVPPGIRIRLADIPRFEERERADDVERASAAREVARQARAEPEGAYGMPSSTKTTSPKPSSDQDPPSGYHTVQVGTEHRVITTPASLEAPPCRVPGNGVQAIAGDVTFASGRAATGADGAAPAVADPDDASAQPAPRPDRSKVLIEDVGDEKSSLTNTKGRRPRRVKPVDFSDDRWELDEEPAEAAAARLRDDDIDRIVRAAHDELQKSCRNDVTKEPSSTTIAQYAAIAERLEAEGNHLYYVGEEEVPPIRLLALYCRNAKTFKTYRAALAHRQKVRIRRWLAKLAADRAAGRDARVAAANVDWATRNLDALDIDRKLFMLTEWGPEATTTPSRSKKHQLRLLPEGWMEKYLSAEERFAEYRCASVILRYTGLRPSELARGVEVEEGGAVLRMTILGSKVGPVAGQPKRSFVVKKSSLPPWFVDEVRNAGGGIRVAAGAKALNSHLGRLTEEVIGDLTDPRTGGRVVISPITFRHALVTEMRGQGWSHEEIAPAMGHTAAVTGKRHYGLSGRGGSRRRAPEVAIQKDSVVAARPVRPVDRTDGDAWLSNQASKRARKGRSTAGSSGPRRT